MEFSSQLTTNIQIAIIVIRIILKITSWNINYIKWMYNQIKTNKLKIIDLGFILYLLIKTTTKLFIRN